MDPLSQAVLGSVASQSVRNKTSLIRVGTIGALPEWRLILMC